MKSKVIHQDVYISSVLYVVLAFFLSVSMKLPKDSSYFPIMLIAGLAIFNTSVLIKGISRTKEMRNEESAKNAISWDSIKIPLLVFVIIAVYIVLFSLTNFYVATSIFMVALMKFYRVQSWKTIILVTLIFNIFIYVGFTIGLNVPLI